MWTDCGSEIAYLVLLCYSKDEHVRPVMSVMQCVVHLTQPVAWSHTSLCSSLWWISSFIHATMSLPKRSEEKIGAYPVMQQQVVSLPIIPFPASQLFLDRPVPDIYTGTEHRRFSWKKIKTSTSAVIAESAEHYSLHITTVKFTVWMETVEHQ